jgi:hypothetical protein
VASIANVTPGALRAVSFASGKAFDETNSELSKADGCSVDA